MLLGWGRGMCGLLRTTLGIVVALTLWVAADEANAQNSPVASILAPGDAILTGFSGVLAAPPRLRRGDPLDETFINLDGPSMQIQHLVPNGPPSGQLINSPTVFKAPARECRPGVCHHAR